MDVLALLQKAKDLFGSKGNTTVAPVQQNNSPRVVQQYIVHQYHVHHHYHYTYLVCGRRRRR